MFGKTGFLLMCNMFMTVFCLLPTATTLHPSTLEAIQCCVGVLAIPAITISVDLLGVRRPEVVPPETLAVSEAMKADNNNLTCPCMCHTTTRLTESSACDAIPSRSMSAHMIWMALLISATLNRASISALLGQHSAVFQRGHLQFDVHDGILNVCGIGERMLPETRSMCC